MAPPTPRLRLAAISLVAAVLVLGVAVTLDSRHTLGMPFPSLLVDAYGAFSSVYMPSWNEGEMPLRHPDLVVTCDGEPLHPSAAYYGSFPSQRLQACLLRAHEAGRSDVALEFLRQGRAPLVLRQPLRLFGAEEWVFLFGVYSLVGTVVLWSGLLVLLLAGRRSGATAYGLLCIASYVFLITLFDYHTRATYVPFFSAAMIGTAVGCLWLGYAFPEPPARFRLPLRAALMVLSLGAGLAAVWLVAAPLLGLETIRVRRAVNFLFQGSLLLCGISIFVRIRSSAGQHRAELLSAAWGFALLPVLTALGVWVGRGAYLLLPCLIGTLPLSIGYALIRHNILAVTAVLTRRLLVVPLALVALMGAAFTWRSARNLITAYGVPEMLPLLAAAAVFVVLILLGRRVAERLFFPASLQFRPTVEQLSDELATLRAPEAIRETLERVVMRWLPTGRAEVLEVQALGGIAHLPADAQEQLQSGEHLWTLESPWHRQLLVPMRSLGELRGVLLLAPKHQAALYTSEDLDLLHTIAGLGAVALHHTQVLRELDTLRQAQVEAARDEKRMALALLGAEISHEIAYPLNFFRHLLRQADREQALHSEDIEIGREEIERLERMLGSLRRLSLPQPHLEPVALLPRARRALDLIRDQIQDLRLSVSAGVPPEMFLLAEPDAMVQLLANLLRNAAQAAGEGGQIGVRAWSEDSGNVLEVWDDGPGVPESFRSTLFDPWVSTKKDGLGLGLAVTQRILRRFGWSISIHREAERTCFRVHAPHQPGLAPTPSQESA